MNKIGVETMKDILGHENVQVTLGIYAHLSKQNVIKASSKVGESIDSI